MEPLKLLRMVFCVRASVYPTAVIFNFAVRAYRRKGSARHVEALHVYALAASVGIGADVNKIVAHLSNSVVIGCRLSTVRDPSQRAGLLTKKLLFSTYLVIEDELVN